MRDVEQLRREVAAEVTAGLFDRDKIEAVIRAGLGEGPRQPVTAIRRFELIGLGQIVAYGAEFPGGVCVVMSADVAEASALGPAAGYPTVADSLSWVREQHPETDVRWVDP